MRFRVGGTFSSRDKMRGNTVTVHGTGAQTSRVKLKYLGKNPEARFGLVHEYEVVAVTEMRRIK